MISNITIGGGFKGALRYAYEKESAKPLYRNGVFGKDAGAIAGEMRAVADQKNIKNPVFHISLSLDNEHGSDEQWKLASEAYLTKMGFDLEKSQYTVTRHKDTKHDHCHIIANRVMLDGRVVSDSNSFKRSHEATRSAEAAAGLNAFDKTAQQTLKGKLHGLKSHINDSLAQHKNYQAFKADLKTKGIEILENRAITTGRLNGLSYKLTESGQVWKGSALGKDYSANGLTKRGLDIGEVSQSPIGVNQNDIKNNHFDIKTPSIYRKNHTKTRATTPTAKRGRRMRMSDKKAFFNDLEM